MIVHNKIYLVFQWHVAFEIGEFVATTGGNSAAGLLGGTKAQEVIDNFFLFETRIPVSGVNL
jgi:hypothetical protein